MLARADRGMTSREGHERRHCCLSSGAAPCCVGCCVCLVLGCSCVVSFTAGKRGWLHAGMTKADQEAAGGGRGEEGRVGKGWQHCNYMQQQQPCDDRHDRRDKHPSLGPSLVPRCSSSHKPNELGSISKGLPIRLERAMCATWHHV